ncbi:hypothetical protein D3C72_1729160 [compost metagenome]
MGANDGQRQPLCQLARAARVVDVGVGEPDLFERDAQTLDFCEQHIQVAAGVDHGRLVGGVAPDEGAVLLKRGNGDGEVAEHAALQFLSTEGENTKEGSDSGGDAQICTSQRVKCLPSTGRIPVRVLSNPPGYVARKAPSETVEKGSAVARHAPFFCTRGFGPPRCSKLSPLCSPQ